MITLQGKEEPEDRCTAATGVGYTQGESPPLPHPHPHWASTSREGVHFRSRPGTDCFPPLDSSAPLITLSSSHAEQGLIAPMQVPLGFVKSHPTNFVQTFYTVVTAGQKP